MRGGRLLAGALFVAGVACSASTRSGNAQSKVGGIALQPVATRLEAPLHARYATNGRFYVNYAGRRGDARVERYVAAPPVDTADPLGSGQDLGSLLGKLLRIDVDRGEP
jgi:hypothetical protein